MSKPDEPVTVADLHAFAQRLDAWKQSVERELETQRATLAGLHRITTKVFGLSRSLTALLATQEERITLLAQRLGLPVVDSKLREQLRGIMQQIAGEIDETDKT